MFLRREECKLSGKEMGAKRKGNGRRWEGR